MNMVWIAKLPPISASLEQMDEIYIKAFESLSF